MRDSVVIDLLDPDAATIDDVMPDDIHPSAMRHLLAVPAGPDSARPRLESQGPYIFGILIVPRPHLEGQDDAAEVYYQEVDVVLDEHRLVIVRKTPPEGEPFDLTNVLDHCARHPTSPGMALYFLFNEIAEQYLDLVDAFNEEIDELEDNVNLWRSSEIRERLSRLRHDILHIRKTLSPTRDAARSVLDGRLDLGSATAGDELFPREIELHFADCYDKLLRAVDGLDLSRDLIAGVRDYHQGKIANDQNEVMKRLTIVSSLLLPPTFIVGLYGQNFIRLPELHWQYGYLFSWFLIVSSTALQLVWFRRRRWF